MRIADVSALTEQLDGVREARVKGVLEWRFHGRLVARQLDEDHVVIRADFEVRDTLIRRFGGTFDVPRRFRQHMMVVADLPHADAGAVEEALVAAWELQRGGG